ncbi:hypothetical protein [Clostridium sp. KNHs205]|uniref:hypothetical protein n=1 Tax=Clostridium sp. KNHs205 TaxID=1449050 RepID=UPI000A7A8F3A|nr:hypothetical protein [Clostridium sp. KNHs205]
MDLFEHRFEMERILLDSNIMSKLTIKVVEDDRTLGKEIIMNNLFSFKDLNSDI